MSDTQADTATEITATVPATGANVTTTLDANLDDPAKEIAKWKELARKHEDRAKSNADAAKELDKLRQQTMSDVEKAAVLAKAEGRTEALREVGTKLVDAEVRAAAAGRNVDVDALLEGLDRSRFLDDDGDPDVKAIAAWVDRIAPQPDPDSGRPHAFDLGQGVRHDASTSLGGDPLERDLKAKLGIS